MMKSPARPKHPLKRRKKKKKAIKITNDNANAAITNRQKVRQKEERRQRQRQNQRLRLTYQNFNHEAAILGLAKGNEYLSSLPSLSRLSVSSSTSSALSESSSSSSSSMAAALTMLHADSRRDQSQNQAQRYNNQRRPEGQWPADSEQTAQRQGDQRYADKAAQRQPSPLVEALRIYTDILAETSPGHPGAFLNRSLCYLLLGRPHLAAFDARRAIMAVHYAREGPRGNVRERQLLACWKAGCVDDVGAFGVGVGVGAGAGADEGDGVGELKGGTVRRRRHWTDELLDYDDDDDMSVSTIRARWTQRPYCFVCKGSIELLDVGLASIALTANTTTATVSAVEGNGGLVGTPPKRRDRAREMFQLRIDAVLKGYYRLTYALWQCGGGALMGALDVLTEVEGICGANFSQMDKDQFKALGNRVMEDIAGLMGIEALSSSLPSRLGSVGGSSETGGSNEERKENVKNMLRARFTTAKKENYPWNGESSSGGISIGDEALSEDGYFKAMFPGCDWRRAEGKPNFAVAEDVGYNDGEKGDQAQYRLFAKNVLKGGQEEEKVEEEAIVEEEAKEGNKKDAKLLAVSSGLRACTSSMLRDGTILCQNCYASIWILEESGDEDNKEEGSSRKTSVSTVVEEDGKRIENNMDVRQGSPDAMCIDVKIEDEKVKSNHGNKNDNDDNDDWLYQSFYFKDEILTDKSQPFDLKAAIKKQMKKPEGDFNSNQKSTASSSNKQCENPYRRLSSSSKASQSPQKSSRDMLRYIYSVRLDLARQCESGTKATLNPHDLRICPRCQVAAFCSSRCFTAAQEYHGSLCGLGLEEYSNAGVITDDDARSSMTPPPTKQKLAGLLLLKVLGMAKLRGVAPLELPVVKYLKSEAQMPGEDTVSRNEKIGGGFDCRGNDKKNGINGAENLPINSTSPLPPSQTPWSYDANILRPLHSLYLIGGDDLSLDTKGYDGWVINTLFSKIYDSIRIHSLYESGRERVEKHFDAMGRLVAEKVVGMEDSVPAAAAAAATPASVITERQDRSLSGETKTKPSDELLEGRRDEDVFVAVLDPVLDYIQMESDVSVRVSARLDGIKHDDGDNTFGTELEQEPARASNANANAQLFSFGSNLICAPLASTTSLTCSVLGNGIEEGGDDCAGAGGGNSNSNSNININSNSNNNSNSPNVADSDISMGDCNINSNTQAETRTEPQRRLNRSRRLEPGTEVICKDSVRMLLRSEDVGEW